MSRGSKERVPKTAKSPASVDFRDFRSTSTHLAILTPHLPPLQRLIYSARVGLIMKTLKVRIDPTSEQRKAIDHNIEANRIAYNNYLTACRLQYDSTKKLPSVFDLNNIGTRMRKNSSFVADAYSMTLNATAKRAVQACEKTLAVHEVSTGCFYVDTMGFTGLTHFPRHKSKGQFDSYTYPSARDFAVVMDRDEKGRRRRRLRLGKVPGLLRCYNQVTELKGEIKTCTICRKDMGKYSEYYACITYDPSPEKVKVPKKGPVGVDIGIKNIAALSDGTVFPNNRAYQRNEEDLRLIQKRLSRTARNTELYNKLRTKLNHIYERISNVRRNDTETISRYIVDNHDVIAMEDLSVEQLRRRSRNKKMTNGYNDVKLGELRKRIRDKAESAGRAIILVDPKGTSQTCSCCGGIVKKDLSVRMHVCPACGLEIDRDVNAARNILARALPAVPIHGSTGDPSSG